MERKLTFTINAAPAKGYGIHGSNKVLFLKGLQRIEGSQVHLALWGDKETIFVA
ncbi:hypothetical protein Q0F98_35445 [Paenibacillus amylolyticus]|nr:hypothetical protein Q0F98_35445 [Paenibacillus amylolyticus]